MGYGGKLAEQVRARELRAAGWTMPAIAAELGVARSSVSHWVRDVPYVRPAWTGAKRGPNRLQQAKAAEIERLRADGTATIGQLSEREFLVAGLALYVGEGAKRDGDLALANTDPRVVGFFCAWLRQFFDIDEARLRARLYLHADLDLDASMAFWVEVTDLPAERFLMPYRAVADASRRQRRHEHGCITVRYRSSVEHRKLMGLAEALLCLPLGIPG